MIVSKAEFERRRRSKGARGTLLPFLRGLAFAGTKLALDRSKDDDRDVEL